MLGGVRQTQYIKRLGKVGAIGHYKNYSSFKKKKILKVSKDIFLSQMPRQNPTAGLKIEKTSMFRCLGGGVPCQSYKPLIL